MQDSKVVFDACRGRNDSKFKNIAVENRNIAVEKSFLDLTQALEGVMSSNLFLRHARTYVDVLEGLDQVRYGEITQDSNI